MTIAATPDRVERLWRRASYIASTEQDEEWSKIAATLNALIGPRAVPVPGRRVATDEPEFTIETHWRDL